MSLVFVLFWYSKPEYQKDGCHAPLRPNACAPACALCPLHPCEQCHPVHTLSPTHSTFKGIPRAHRALSRTVTAVISQEKEESEVGVKAQSSSPPGTLLPHESGTALCQGDMWHCCSWNRSSRGALQHRAINPEPLSARVRHGQPWY